MAKNCPFTSPKVLKETTKGELIEVDPEKDDNIFEVEEKLALLVMYHNSAVHAKRPLKGIPVTIKERKNEGYVVDTDTKGLAYFSPSKPGFMIVSYYDQYQKRTIPIGLNIIVASAPEPKKKAKAVDEPTKATKEGIKLFKLIRRLFIWIRLLKRNSTR